jgi:Protein of unknown function (DUF3592)/Mu transposase, C-terminal
MVVFGVWLALGGAIAFLAGLAGARRRRTLRRGGLTAWAMVLPTPSEPEDGRSGSSGVSVQFALDDGRVIERAHGQQKRRSAALRPGERVLVWYDPADAGDVLVYGSDSRWSDRVFMALGVLLLAVGLLIVVAFG